MPENHIFAENLVTQKYNPSKNRMKYNFRLKHFLVATLFSLFLFSFTGCKKDVVDNDPSIQLAFSTDTVTFDTVFTSIGSATRQLRVYNPSNSKIIVSDISLGNGDGSVFRMNVDGQPGTSVQDIEIDAHDSIFIFLRVTIDPTNENNPFVIEDDLRFLTNGNEQTVKLEAWGQNAVYIVADTYTPGFPKYKIIADSLETVHWTNEKPYVIYGYAVINSYGTLIIDPGTRVHFHANSGLWAYSDGLLKVLGTLDEPVHFSGDRLEQDYQDLPGQWDRIWLMESTPGENHEIRNAVIENGFVGIQTESFLRVADNFLIMENVKVQNMTGIGLFSRIYNIVGGNVVVANCGGYGMAFTGGGNYGFIQTTIGNYWTYGVRKTPSLFLNNFILDTLDNPIPIPMNFYMGNSIIYGNNDEEFETEMVDGADSAYLLKYVLLKSERTTLPEDLFDSVWLNQDPLFKSYEENDYRLDTLSPAIDRGNEEIAADLPEDIRGNSRLPLPDLGAYEYIPGEDTTGQDNGFLPGNYLFKHTHLNQHQLFQSPGPQTVPGQTKRIILK